MRNQRVIKKIGEKISDASQKISDELIKANLDWRGIEAREDKITHQLEEKLTYHLLQEIEKSFKMYAIRGVNFDAYVYRSDSEEPKTGADIAGLIEITILNKNNRKTIRKAYLAQAKIVNRKYTFPYHSKYYKTYDTNILTQAKNMLKITSDSFFFLYAIDGIFVVPALEIYLFDKNSIDTRYYYKKKFGSFYEEFFKCFIGDHHISPFYNKPMDLISFIKDFEIKNIIYIQAKIERNQFGR